MFKKILVGIFAIIASIGMAIASVNINTATQAELETLPGVGPAKAKAIIDYRKTNGNFKTIDDIKNVKGFGDKTFDKLKPQLVVSGANASAPAAPAKAEKPAKADKSAAASAPASSQSAPAKADKKAKK
jgi:competence protein ComEA